MENAIFFIFFFDFFFHLFVTFCTKIYITTSYTVYQHINMYSFIFPMCEYKPLYIMLFKDKKKKKREERKNRDEHYNRKKNNNDN